MDASTIIAHFDEYVRKAAYFLWVKRRPGTDDPLGDWLAAKNQIEEMIEAAGDGSTASADKT